MPALRLPAEPMNTSKRGRKPKQIVKLEPLAEIPSPDEWGLCKYGVQYWNTHAPQLIKLEILTELHVPTFAELCRHYGEYRRLTDWLDEDPDRAIITTDKGYQLEAPQVRMRDRAFKTVQQLWPKFGLHPLSLAQMRKHGGIASKKTSGIEDFARGKYGSHSGPSLSD